MNNEQKKAILEKVQSWKCMVYMDKKSLTGLELNVKTAKDRIASAEEKIKKLKEGIKDE